MITRRGLLGAGLIPLLPDAGHAAPRKNLVAHRIAGSTATVTLLEGPTAEMLLHIARRWHYEIASIDTGEGGGIAASADGTAITLHPAAYPVGGTETLWPHQEIIVRDILLDCDGTVAWTPAAPSHFRVAITPSARKLAHVNARRAGSCLLR